MDLKDFNHQNVIAGLILSREDKEEGRTEFEISLKHCYGLSGIIRAEGVSVGYSAAKHV